MHRRDHGIEEAARQLPCYGSWDVLVVGAGAGGIAAALAAARSGARVLLVEKACLPGGLATRGLINWLEPYCDGRGRRVLGGIAWEMFTLAIEYGHGSAGHSPETGRHSGGTGRLATWFSPEIFMLAVEALLAREGISLLYDTLCAGPWMAGTALKGAFFEGVEGRFAVEAKAVVDATGDARLFHLAGAPCETGTNYLTMRAYGMDLSSQRQAAQAGDAYRARIRLKHGATMTGAGQPAGMPPVAGITSREVSDFVMRAREMLFAQVCQEPRLARDIIALPAQPQLRTIRHIVGAETFLGAEDHVHRPDSIGVAPDFTRPGALYEIPFGCLYAPTVDNLLACGRIVSARGHGWDVIRVLGPAFLTGEAAGLAASMVARQGGAAAALDIPAIQDALRKNANPIHIAEVGT